VDCADPKSLPAIGFCLHHYFWCALHLSGRIALAFAQSHAAGKPAAASDLRANGFPVGTGVPPVRRSAAPQLFSKQGRHESERMNTGFEPSEFRVGTGVVWGRA